MSALRANNVSAAYLLSSQTQAEKASIYRDLAQGDCGFKLLYVTPEGLSASGRLKQALRNLHGVCKQLPFLISDF